MINMESLNDSITNFNYARKHHAPKKMTRERLNVQNVNVPSILRRFCALTLSSTTL